MYYINFTIYKLFNLICYVLNQKLNIKFIKYLPIKMDIEPTTGCNFRCTMCEVSQPGFIKRNMNLETFEKIILENKQLLSIRLQGLGEPFVNKNFINMINLAQKYFIKIDFVTNGSLINKKKINQLIQLNNLRSVYVSIDGSTSDTFEKIRIGSNFNQIIKNLKLLNESNSKLKKKIKIKAMMLIQKSNFHEAEEVIMLSKSLGFSGIDFQVKLTGFGNKDLERKNLKQQIMNGNKLNPLELLQNYKKKYETKDFKFNIISHNLFSKENKCNYPWQRPFIDTKGFVVPCCMIANSKIFNLGNIYQNNFKSIWNSVRYQNFRKSITNHKLHDFCKTCYINDK